VILKLEISPASGGRFWYLFAVGKYKEAWIEHREGDYPAMIYDDGVKYWYRHGVHVKDNLNEMDELGVV
jgi:hypothetical protein